MRNTYDWVAIVTRGRSQPNVWLRPPLRNVPYRLVKRVRLRQHPDLRLPDGRLEAKAEHRYTDDDGTERADIWLRFVPSTPRGRMERKTAAAVPTRGDHHEHSTEEGRRPARPSRRRQ